MPHVASDPVDDIPGFLLERDEAANDAGAAFGIQHAEGQILKLFAHPLHPHAARKRRIDVHGFARFLDLLFRLHRLDRPHVVQTVGQLDEDHTQIFGHGHEQLAEILGLFGFGAGKLEIGQLGHPINQHRHLVTKANSYFGIGGFGVFDGVVQKRGDDRRIVKLLFSQNRGNSDRMREIGFARVTKLTLMHLAAIVIGRADERLIGLGVVVAHQRNKVVCRDHRRLIHMRPASRRALALTLRLHQRAEQLFFGKIVVAGLVGFRTHKQRHCVFFRLVHFDLRLIRFDQALAKFVRRLSFVRNFAKRNNGVLVIVAIDRDCSTCRHFAGAMRGKHHKLKTIWDFVNAIFNRHAGHGNSNSSGSL